MDRKHRTWRMFKGNAVCVSHQKKTSLRSLGLKRCWSSGGMLVVATGSSGGAAGEQVGLESSGLVEIDAKYFQQEESADEGNAWINLTLDHLCIPAELVWSILSYCVMCEFSSLLGGVYFLSGCFGDICDKWLCSQSTQILVSFSELQLGKCFQLSTLQ